MEEQEAEDTPSNDRRQRTPREGSYREDRVVDTPAREQGKMLDETYGGMVSSRIGGLIRQTIQSPRVGHWPPL